eukprot:gene21082-7912_t
MYLLWGTLEAQCAFRHERPLVVPDRTQVHSDRAISANKKKPRQHVKGNFPRIPEQFWTYAKGPPQATPYIEPPTRCLADNINKHSQSHKKLANVHNNLHSL